MDKHNKSATGLSPGKRLPNQNAPRLLVVGPLPPPPDGPSVSFQLFCDETKQLAHLAESATSSVSESTKDEIQAQQMDPSYQLVLGDLRIIDSSPKRLKDEHTRKLSLANFMQASRIILPFIQHVMRADRVLLFGGDGFVLSIGLLLLVISKILRKPCYFRVFGGSLDRFYAALNPFFRQLLRLILNRADGFIVQTALLNHFLADLIGDKVHYIPGYRHMPANVCDPRPVGADFSKPLRLAYVGHIREEKGIFVLLESLRKLESSGEQRINCDLFGPVYEADEAQFTKEVARTANASYQGVLSPKSVVSTLRNYDALVFASYYPGEGHPGVLIEAMMAGIPVITTTFRSIPELVEDRVNGLLVAPRDVDALTAAIKTLDADRILLAEMGRKNWEKRINYDARHVVPRILQIVGLNLVEQKS